MSKACPYCLSLRSATMAFVLMSLIFSMSMITASVTSISYRSTMNPFILTAFLVNGIADFVASILCIRGVCTESSNYLLPWIFTVSVGTIFMFLVAISYMMYSVQSYMVFGVILFVLAMFFSAGWICVLCYYYQLYDKKHQTTATRRPQHTMRNNTIVTDNEISATSFSSVILDDYRSQPPPYAALFKTTVILEKENQDNNNKLPSYEEIFVAANNETVTEGIRRF